MEQLWNLVCFESRFLGKGRVQDTGSTIEYFRNFVAYMFEFGCEGGGRGGRGPCLPI